MRNDLACAASALLRWPNLRAETTFRTLIRMNVEIAADPAAGTPSERCGSKSAIYFTGERELIYTWAEPWCQSLKTGLPGSGGKEKMRMCRSVLRVLCLVALFGVLAFQLSAQKKKAKTPKQSNLQGSVQSLDKSKMMITIRT